MGLPLLFLVWLFPPTRPSSLASSSMQPSKVVRSNLSLLWACGPLSHLHISMGGAGPHFSSPSSFELHPSRAGPAWGLPTAAGTARHATGALGHTCQDPELGQTLYSCCHLFPRRERGISVLLEKSSEPGAEEGGLETHLGSFPRSGGWGLTISKLLTQQSQWPSRDLLGERGWGRWRSHNTVGRGHGEQRGPGDTPTQGQHQQRHTPSAPPTQDPP